jgi:diguanylate cyclase
VLTRHRLALARALSATTAAALALTAALLLAEPGRAPSTLTDVPYLVVVAGVTALAALRASTTRSDRGAWWAITAACAAWTAGMVAWVGGARDDSSFPTLADAGYLLFYPPAYVGLGLLARERLTRAARRLWLDGATAAAAVATLASAAVVGAIVAGTGGDTATVAVALAYPVGDLLLLTLVVAVLVADGRRLDVRWALFAAGLALFAVADTVYLWRVAEERYVENTLLDLGWPVALALLAAAAWAPRHRAPGRTETDPTGVPAGAVLLAVGVLAFAGDDGLTRALAVLTALLAVVRFLVSLRDERALAAAKRLALTDDQTGLPNRRELLRSLDALTGAGARGALLLVDVDRGAGGDDAHGVAAADRTLREAARRLATGLRPGDLLARVAGDEFAVLLAGAGDPLPVAHRLRRALHEGGPEGDAGVALAGTVAVARFPDDESDPVRLLRCADLAMVQARTDRRGVGVYDRAQDAQSRDRIALTTDFRRGLDAGEIELRFQPQVRARDGRPCGAEALVRWRHPERGLLGPGAFLPVVEQTAVMLPLTERVLRLALAQQGRWREEGLNVPVSVNLATPCLLDPAFPATVRAVLEASGAGPDDLVLEVTENALMTDVDRALSVLHGLHALGVRLSIDDFGTGHSSLARLKELPVDELKIDRSFLLGGEGVDAAIVRAAASLGHELGLAVVAEGVETEAMWEAAWVSGCDRIQGFLVAEPLEGDAVRAWADAWPARMPARVALASVPRG